MTLRVLTSLVGCALLSSAAVATPVLDYQPSLGTKPAAQGWTYAGDGAEAGSVTSGVFSYGPTTMSGLLYWNHVNAGVVDFGVGTWSLEARVQLTDTSFGNVAGFRRGGFTLYLEDDFGRAIIADIGSSVVSLRNDNNGPSDPVASVDLASSFRTIKLEARAADAALYVDGVLVLTHSYGLPTTGINASWGEASVLASTGRTDVEYVRLVPSPGAAGLALCMGGLAMRRRRR